MSFRDAFSTALGAAIALLAIGAFALFTGLLPAPPEDARVAALEQQLAAARESMDELEASARKTEAALVALQQAVAAGEAARKAAAVEMQEAARKAAAIEMQEAARRAAAAQLRAAEERAEAEKVAAEARELEQAEQAARNPLGPPVLRHEPGAAARRLLAEARALEAEGKVPEAVRAYTRAARSGDGKAAKRLGEIYAAGLGEVSRDYAESLKWYNAARLLGEEVGPAKFR